MATTVIRCKRCGARKEYQSMGTSAFDETVSVFTQENCDLCSDVQGVGLRALQAANISGRVIAAPFRAIRLLFWWG